MTDFVKVNFKDGYSCYTSKIGIELSHFDGSFYAYTFTLSATIANSIRLFDNGSQKVREVVNAFYEITKEEYDRLCKELGIEE